LAQEVDVVEAQLLAHRGELFQEELDAPQRRVVGLVGVATSQLVVEDDRASTVGELLKGRR
jgi:mitochondrial fission protein ELM1